ncbi:LPXTG-motif cell wall-anchored protein [Leucobacter luti]|uniref:LPXTG-motif cell wall-anchored protein n=3 Tax=Leucobacter luti TaxID=340320 RepID=A0A4Q7U074_9MICO|nr:LPXTG-motif cell wall-anchored protein [Leucobacter luti]
MRAGHMRLAGALALGVALGVGTLTPASAVSDELFVIDERAVTIDAPAPGETATWSFELASSQQGLREVFVRVSGVEGPLFEGDTPAKLRVGAASLEPALEGSPVELLTLDPTLLGEFSSAEPLTLQAELELPRTAGNEYQGASGSLTLQVASPQRDTTPVPQDGPGARDGLAVTGGASWYAIAAAGIGAALLGAFTLLRKRRNQGLEVEL